MEYDTVSDKFTQFLEKEALPAAVAAVKSSRVRPNLGRHLDLGLARIPDPLSLPRPRLGALDDARRFSEQ